MARGIDLYKKVQSMKISPEKDKASSSPGEKDVKQKAGERFLDEIEKKKGLLREAPLSGLPGKTPAEGKGLEHVAKFLLLLGKEEAGKVLKNLSEDEVEKICGEIARIKRVDSVESQEILQEFGFLRTTGGDRSMGGVGTARDILVSAFGEEKGTELLDKAVPESKTRPFAFLEDVELPQLLNLVKDESPMVLSVLLSSLDPLKSSQIIKSLDNATRTAVILRMGHMEKIDPKAVSLMEQTLMDRLNKQGLMESIELDGPDKLASILKYMPLSEEKKILEELAENDEKLSGEVKEKLLTIDTVMHISDDDLQKALQEFTEKDIAQLVRGKDEEIGARILMNLSTRRRQFVLEESELMGPIPRTDADKVTRDFLEYLREKEEAGELVIMREEEEYL